MSVSFVKWQVVCFTLAHCYWWWAAVLEYFSLLNFCFPLSVNFYTWFGFNHNSGMWSGLTWFIWVWFMWWGLRAWQVLDVLWHIHLLPISTRHFSFGYSNFMTWPSSAIWKKAHQHGHEVIQLYSSVSQFDNLPRWPALSAVKLITGID